MAVNRYYRPKKLRVRRLLRRLWRFRQWMAKLWKTPIYYAPAWNSRGITAHITETAEDYTKEGWKIKWPTI